MRIHTKRIRGFSALDLLIVIATVVVLAGIALPMMSRSSTRAPRIQCVSNLKQVGLGFRLYADDGEPYPKYESTNEAWNYFQIVGKEIGSPKVLICPKDSRRTTALDFETNSVAANFSHPDNRNAALSYFYGTEAAEELPNMILAGDRNITTNKAMLSGLLYASTNSLTWTEQMHEGAGNIALADGSAMQVSERRLRDQIAVGNTNGIVQRFVLP